MEITGIKFSVSETRALKSLVHALPAAEREEWGLTPDDVAQFDAITALPARRSIDLADHGPAVRATFRLTSVVGDADGSMTRLGIGSAQTKTLLGLFSGLECLAAAEGWEAQG